MCTVIEEQFKIHQSWIWYKLPMEPHPESSKGFERAAHKQDPGEALPLTLSAPLVLLSPSLSHHQSYVPSTPPHLTSSGSKKTTGLAHIWQTTEHGRRRGGAMAHFLRPNCAETFQASTWTFESYIHGGQTFLLFNSTSLQNLLQIFILNTQRSK